MLILPESEADGQLSAKDVERHQEWSGVGSPLKVHFGK